MEGQDHIEKTTGFRKSNQVYFQKMLTLTNLSTLGIGGQQVHHLNTSYQNLLFYTHVGKFRSLSVDWGSAVEVIFLKY